MATLDAAERKKLPNSDYGLPSQRAYPIQDIAHARMALAMAAKNASPAELAEIRKNVHEKYPSIDIGGG